MYSDLLAQLSLALFNLGLLISKEREKVLESLPNNSLNVDPLRWRALDAGLKLTE